MKKYAKIINDATNECQVGLGTNSAFYRSIGMSEIEVEQSYEGRWYQKGFAPKQSVEDQNEAIRREREQLYQSLIDPLHARKARKELLRHWNDADEQEYIAKVTELSDKIEKENPYINIKASEISEA